jgi:hypothetical protein
MNRKDAAIVQILERTKAAIERCKSQYPEAWPYLAHAIVMCGMCEAHTIAATSEVEGWGTDVPLDKDGGA